MPAPGWRAWLAATVVGGLMLGGGNGTVCWAEQWVPSGETALILAAGPLWTVVLPWICPPRAGRRGRWSRWAWSSGWPAWPCWSAAAAAGAGRRGGRALLVGRLSLLVRQPLLGVGSLWSSTACRCRRRRRWRRRWRWWLPARCWRVAALAHGEWGRFHLAAVTPGAWARSAYLVVFGSLAGFGSYIYVLVHAGPTRASTGAFVNPLIAVVLGTAVAGEAMGARTGIAALMIVSAVAARHLGQRSAPNCRLRLILCQMQTPPPTGLRLIVTYKFIKAALQVAAAVLLFYGAAHGLNARLIEFAEELREHAVHAWSNVFAAALLRFTHSKHSLGFTAYALLADAVLSSVEGWAISRGTPGASGWWW